MDCLIPSHDYILSWLPFKPSLSCYYIVREHLFASEFFESVSTKKYPSLLPAESFVFCDDEACIFDALNAILVIMELNAHVFAIFIIICMEINWYCSKSQSQLIHWSFILLFWQVSKFEMNTLNSRQRS